jgi:hypothetical protein
MVSREASGFLLQQRSDRNNAWKVDAVSHLIRKISDATPDKPVYVNEDNSRRWFEDPALSLESPMSQAENLILWLGTSAQTTRDPAAFLGVNHDELASIIGSRCDHSSSQYIAKQLFEGGLIEFNRQGASTSFSGRLTFKGWNRFHELQRSPILSRRAFMAMKFNDPRLDRVYAECFAPAVADAGFELQRLIDGQGAGLIDDQLRVRIRTSKFLIADLSSGNKGAYWEAGFAEGLGRPVIYVCEEEVWKHEDAAMRPHFDTAHLNTISWNEQNLDNARQKLANTIRNTFPAEAKFG